MTEDDYQALWHEVREKVLLLRSLDLLQQDKLDLYRKPSRLVHGASVHGYHFAAMPEDDIVAFEKHYAISLPLNFRTYLSVFGFYSSGPGYGIWNGLGADYMTVNAPNLHKSCPLEPRKGIGFESSDDNADFGDSEYSFKYEAFTCGTFAIATSGSPCINSLVIHGHAKGHVFSCTGDMLFYDGTFEDWYVKWLDDHIEQLTSP